MRHRSVGKTVGGVLMFSAKVYRLYSDIECDQIHTLRDWKKQTTHVKATCILKIYFAALFGVIWAERSGTKTTFHSLVYVPPPPGWTRLQDKVNHVSSCFPVCFAGVFLSPAGYLGLSCPQESDWCWSSRGVLKHNTGHDVSKQQQRWGRCESWES